MTGYGRVDAARKSADFLAEIQDAHGSVGIRGDQKTPRWPTGLAVLVWLAVDDESDGGAESDTDDAGTGDGDSDD